ncbi:unnamed protein product [Adineta steineri]|uniref:LRRNT domain-containing protein n=2 Tax=Adineta steineri TaxID=433720 RepID=A0A818KSM5_9BILA|nr:unnamed protein product [Adineta steineri]CAF3559102.1 unnamed protein product [Adineta steineri]
MSTLRPLYPCHYKDLNQRIYKCDMCTCLLSPPMFSTSNLCSSLLSTSSLVCSDNSTKIPNEELLRLRLNEIEFESNHQFLTSYSIIPKKSFNDIQFEFDNFNNDIIENLLNFEQFCSSLNNSRLTFYRLQTNLSFNQINQCRLTIFSLRFLDTTIENNLLILHTKPDTLIFYNCTFNINSFNLTSTTTTLAFYYVKFHSKLFLLNSLSSLIHLTITHTINFDIIGSYPNLIYLDLCHTQLDDIQLNRLFSQIEIPDLVTLILSNNHITTLKTKFPLRVRYLDLSNNQIKSLDYTSFKSLYSLNTLNLSYNSLLDIQQDTFTRIPYLEILDLTSSLPSLPVDDLFLPLQKLRYLNISSNNLNSLPRFPVPYDAHTIASYDHHLPVLYVDMSNNNLNQIDFDMFSSASTQDKYIISIDLTFNQLKTLQLPSMISTGIKRRGPLIELNINNNPLECDCILYENIFPLLQTDVLSQQQNTYNLPLPFQPPPQQVPSGYYPNQYLPSGIVTPPPLPTPLLPYAQSGNSLNYIRSRRQLNPSKLPTSASLLAQNLVKQARIKLLNLSNLTCKDMTEPNQNRSLFDLNSTNSFCLYTKSCPSTCSCCSSSTSSLLFNINNCECYYQCPIECTCKHSFDLLKNYVNCSNRYLNKLPFNIPHTTTHLNLNHNQLKSLGKNLTDLTKLQYLSISNNRLESLLNDDFSTLNKIENLDLSSNQIQTIEPRAFSTMFHLKHLYLHDNIWIPKFYNGNGEFQSNTRLNVLTYGKNFVCNRSAISSSFTIETPLTADDCCKHTSNIESCRQSISTNEFNFQPDNEHSSAHSNKNSKKFFQMLFHEKYRLYVFIGLSILILIILCVVILCSIFCLCRKKKHLKHPSPAERKLLSNGDSKKTTNHYHKTLQATASSTPPQMSLSASTTAIQKLINSTRQKSITSNTAYKQQENDASVSYSDNDDEDDYASIPLTVSQNDLATVIRPQPVVPPLPPPRQTQQQQQQQRLLSNRPLSHSSTVSTSTTIRSIVPMLKRTNSSGSKHAQSSLTPARSCLQIKLDALVLYSINDSELVHGNIGEYLEDMYGKRFSFYFLHRDRMLGELDWLIENSCVTIIILRKPYHIVHDYMKILSTCSSIKIFLILVNDEQNHHSSSSSIKAREKIAKLYRTTNIYEWNSNPSSLIHEQLELFLEQNCGSATYVPY